MCIHIIEKNIILAKATFSPKGYCWISLHIKHDLNRWHFEISVPRALRKREYKFFCAKTSGVDNPQIFKYFLGTLIIDLKREKKKKRNFLVTSEHLQWAFSNSVQGQSTAASDSISSPSPVGANRVTMCIFPSSNRPRAKQWLMQTVMQNEHLTALPLL